MARPMTFSAPPSPYISAVSMSVMPRSRPSLSAATMSAPLVRASPMPQVPMPSTGTHSPLGMDICRMTPVPSVFGRMMLTDHGRSRPVEGGANLGGQRRVGEGLRHQFDAGAELSLVKHGVTRIAGGEEHTERRMLPARFLGELAAVQLAGKADIGE